jgi:hypothetical protein
MLLSYKFELADGRKLLVSGDHLRAYKCKSCNGSQNRKITNTIELMNKNYRSLVIKANSAAKRASKITKSIRMLPVHLSGAVV